MKVLIIDDNVKITDMLSSFLNLKGFEVSVSNDGRNGLVMLEDSKFDFCILDIAMPNFCGFDVVEKLNKDKKIGMTKIIVLTAVPLSQAEIKLLEENGVKEIITKPAHLQVLLGALKN